MPPNYEKLHKEAYKKNVEDVSRHVSTGSLDKKIDNFCNQHDLDRKDVIKEINNSYIVAACFAVNPNKQNLYEKEAAKFISRIDGVIDFKNLSNNAKCVSNGGVSSKQELSDRGEVSTAKTIDFEWTYGGWTFFASHKYTKQSGGTQDTAYKDLQSFIKESAPTTLKKVHFVAIADGDFYQQEDPQAGKLKIDRLKSLAFSKQVHACTIDELETLMNKLTRSEVEQKTN